MQGAERMQTLEAFVLLICLPTTGKADGPVQIAGGLSPNGKIAVVVTRDEDTSQESVSSDNEHPLLQDVTNGKIIGPLEEVDTMGGGFGHVLENLTAFWSPDGQYLAVRFRAGRLAEDFVIYRIEHKGTNYRAIPQKLPDLATGPNGAKIFAHASHAANMGAMFKHWLSPTEISVQKLPLLSAVSASFR
jgi:hypothetical protein